jgi:hypothetical protein
MKYVVNLMDVGIHPGEWARKREAQGWDVLSCADHFFTATRPFPHVWVTASAMAAATSTVTITTAFVNNLFRSPVEVALASLSLHHSSHGRFELGLGAGWLRSEMEAAGLAYPEPRDRAGAFIESVQIIRELLHTGVCRFEGSYYDIDVPGLGPLSDTPPRLVASVGGPRTVRGVTPHLDRVEIKASSASTRGGVLDMEAMAHIPDSHLVEMIERVRAVDPEIDLGMFVLCNVGDDDQTMANHKNLEGTLYGRFFGSAGHVAEGLAWLEEIGIGHAQLSPSDDASLDRLAPLLF